MKRLLASLLFLFVLAGCITGDTATDLRLGGAVTLAILNTYTDAVIIAQTPEERAKLRAALVSASDITASIQTLIDAKVVLIDTLPTPAPPLPPGPPE